MKKRTLAIILLVITTISLLAMPALAVVEQTTEFFVADYANVLTSATKDRIVDSNSDSENGLSALCDGAEVVVVTVKYLDGMYSDEYAAQLFNNWQVGDANANNGMLLLLATEEKKGWLEVGAGIRSYWTTSRIENLLDNYFWDDVDAGRYDAAVNSTLEQIFTWFADSYKVAGSAVQEQASDSGYEIITETETYTTYDHGGWYSSYSGWGTYFSGWRSIFWIVVVVIVLRVLTYSLTDRRRYRTYYTHMGMPRPRYHFWYMFGGHRPYRTWHHNHGRTTTHTTTRTTYRPTGGDSSSSRSSGSGFGGFGSSGGRSSGGGFGGFGGGGGGRSSGGGRSGGGGGRR